MNNEVQITWLGQAGLLVETDNIKIVIDPYLSDSVETIEPQNKRRQPIDESFLKIKPDVIICTHNHLDHTDPETLKHYLKANSGVTVLAPEAAWKEIRKFGGKNNYILFNRHTSVTLYGITFYGVKAEHSDIHPIGIILYIKGKKYYITGDTLYNEDIFVDIPKDIEVLFLPVNGVGNNMNLIDAKRFADRIEAKYTVPIHWGLFDTITPEEFCLNNWIVPEIFKPIALSEKNS